MTPRRAVGVAAIAAAVLGVGPAAAAAQAWVPPAHTVTLTFVSEGMNNAGHFLGSGFLLPDGKSSTIGLDLIAGYSFTDRLTVSVGVPYIFARFRGPNPAPPPVPFLPVDSCFCYHSGWQDFTGEVQYNVFKSRDGLAVTPTLAVVIPSRHYDHVGEAVVGRDLRELHVGVDVASPVAAISDRLIVQGSYSYAVVQRVLDDTPDNRSNAEFEGDFRLTRRLTAIGLVIGQRTHGGFRFPDEVLSFPDRVAEHDRLLRDNAVRYGGGLSYAWGAWQASGTYIGFTHGSDTHDIHALTLSLGWTHR